MASSDGGQCAKLPMIDRRAPRAIGVSKFVRVVRIRGRRIKFVAPFAILAGLMLIVVATMVPGDPVGSEFQVNTTTFDNQRYPSVAMSASGDFVVVWSSWMPTWNGFAIYAQLMDSSGAKVGGEFLVDDNSSDDQISPSVAMQANGNFTVVWQTTKDPQANPGTYNSGIRQAFFDSSGTLTDMIADAEGNDPDDSDPAVAMCPSSFQYLTVWTTLDVNTSSEEISGWGIPSPQTNTTINNQTTDNQETPAVAMDSNGESIVVWASNNQDGDFWGVFGQQFLNDGNKSGPEFQVNTQILSHQVEPSVAVDSSGNFVVVWASNNQDGNGYGVFGQRFSSAGMKVGSEFQINTYSDGQQWHPSVAMDSAGEFVVVWASFGQDGSGFAVVGQRYDSDGTPSGSEFQVNTYTEQDQSLPSVSMNGNGDSVVVWQSIGQDGDIWGIFGQLYSDVPIPEYPALVIPVAGTAAFLFVIAKQRRK